MPCHLHLILLLLSCCLTNAIQGCVGLVSVFVTASNQANQARIETTTTTLLMMRPSRTEGAGCSLTDIDPEEQKRRKETTIDSE